MENIILLDVEGKTKSEVIENVANALFEQGKINDLDIYIKAVKERELEITTGFGNGIAIPHGKTSAVKESCFAFAKLKESVDWNSMDGKPVKMLFMLAIPEKEAGTTHLRLLSKIAMAIMDIEFVDKLKETNSISEIKHIIETIK